MSVSLEIDDKALTSAQKLLSNLSGAYEKAASRAINRTLTHVRSDAVKEVREEFTVKAKPLRDSVSIKRAKPQRLQGEFKSSGRSLGLMQFRVNPKTDTTGNRRRRVTAQVRKGEKFEVNKGFVFNRQVFRRVSKARLPVERQTGPSAPQMIGENEIFEKVSLNADEFLQKRLAQETRAILEGHVK